MRKKLVILSLSLLFLLFSLEANDSPYDLTIYPTADNSVMGVLGDKLGLDMTGYMFIGEGTERGLYFRVGVQTPFDTILGYLNLFNNEISTQDKTDSKENKETENRNDPPALDGEELSPSVSDNPSLPPENTIVLPGDTLPDMGNLDINLPDTSTSIIDGSQIGGGDVGISTPSLPETDSGLHSNGGTIGIPNTSTPIVGDTAQGGGITMDIPDSSLSGNGSENTGGTLDIPSFSTGDEEESTKTPDGIVPTTPEESVVGAGENSDNTIEGEESGGGQEEITVGSDGSNIESNKGTVVKGSTTNNNFKKEWRLLVTLGPAYRRFMDENGLVYLGYGISGDFGHKVEVEKDTKYTVTTSYSVLGADLDFGMRYTLKTNTTIRVGVHFTASLLGARWQTVMNTREEQIFSNLDIYGYALSEKGIFETLNGKGYIMLAATFGDKRKTTYNYSNTASKIGGGTITVL